jgi:DNA-binding MurR/RpiR family transcriptional regulator
MFEADIRKGKFSTDQLCQKYRVSRSTANRYIKNYKYHGYVKYKKQLSKSGPEELIKKLLAQNQDLSRRLSRQRGQCNKDD